uniref:Uncharacterized protein n=1 Tax=Myotis myotis TaxID=51298 RepID=A0A7J7V3P6_MYOMY|nr:hypothetical protein mMyoMyo1_008472 [Myotis myotis]
MPSTLIKDKHTNLPYFCYVLSHANQPIRVAICKLTQPRWRLICIYWLGEKTEDNLEAKHYRREQSRGGGDRNRAKAVEAGGGRGNPAPAAGSRSKACLSGFFSLLCFAPAAGSPILAGIFLQPASSFI